MKVIRDGLWLCTDCTFAAVNGDGPEDEERDKLVTEGLTRLGPHLVPDFNSEDDGIETFGTRRCDCCRWFGGSAFHRFAVLGEEGSR